MLGGMDPRRGGGVRKQRRPRYVSNGIEALGGTAQVFVDFQETLGRRDAHALQTEAFHLSGNPNGHQDPVHSDHGGLSGVRLNAALQTFLAPFKPGNTHLGQDADTPFDKRRAQRLTDLAVLPRQYARQHFNHGYLGAEGCK